MSRALITLIAGSIAALVLLITAVLSWRLWRESERINAELANDRQLRVLGEMSALLGHELRNPLASLKGHAQLLAEKLSEDHPARARVDTVVSEAKRLERLTSQVLDFARSARLELRPTRPQDLAHAVIATVEGAQVQLAMREPFGTWRLDAGKMEQVLTNILQNAVQASGDEVGFEVAEQKGELIFVIRDRGPGIAPGEESRIFEPFYTRRAQGTGLGLALAKRIIEGHGGRIEALNHPEGGAMFRVLLPAELRIADPKVSS